MKSIKLLLLSSTIILGSAMLIQPVVAKPTMSVHYLKVGSEHVISTKAASRFESRLSSLPSNPVNNIMTQYVKNIDTNFAHKVSSRLALSSVNRAAAEQLPKQHSLHGSNSFFDSAMIFNDKMQQFISYLKKPNNSLTQAFDPLQKDHKAEVKNQEKECNA